MTDRDTQQEDLHKIHLVKILAICMDMLESQPTKAMKKMLELSEDEKVYAIKFAHKINSLVSMSHPELRGEIAKHEG